MQGELSGELPFKYTSVCQILGEYVQLQFKIYLSSIH